jgi:ankyrin repeat protein
MYSGSHAPISDHISDGNNTLISSPRATPANTDWVNSEALSSALFLASKNGYPEVIRALAERGASLNALDEDGNPALHLALLGKHEDVVATLLKHRVRRHVSNFDGLTPLYVQTARRTMPYVYANCNSVRLLAAKIRFEEGVRILLQDE